MIDFLIGLTAGLAAAAFGLLGVLAGYNPPVTQEWERAATALVALLVALLVAALAAVVAATVMQVRESRRRRQVWVAIERRDPDPLTSSKFTLNLSKSGFR